MSVRVYRAANRANDEAKALYLRISKAQMAVVKDTQELADKHDTSQMARQAQELAKRQAMIRASAEAARFKQAVALVTGVVSTLGAVAGVVAKVIARQHQREIGELGGIEERRLRAEAGRTESQASPVQAGEPAVRAERERLWAARAQAATKERFWGRQVAQGEQTHTTRDLFGNARSTPAASWIHRTLNRHNYDKAAAGLERAEAAWDRFVERHPGLAPPLPAEAPGIDAAPGSRLPLAVTVSRGPLPPAVIGKAPPAGPRPTVIVGAGPGPAPCRQPAPASPALIGPPDAGVLPPSGLARARPAAVTDPLRRWQVRDGGTPLAGSGSARLAALAQMAASQVLTEADLRGNADLFDLATLQELRGLLWADLGASFHSAGAATNLAGNRLAGMAIKAGRSPGNTEMLARAAALKGTASQLIDAVERYRQSGTAADRAAVLDARQGYEDAFLGSDPRPRGQRLLTIEVLMASREGWGKALTALVQTAWRAWEAFNKYQAEADAEFKTLASAGELAAAHHETMRLYGKAGPAPVQGALRR